MQQLQPELIRKLGRWSFLGGLFLFISQIHIHLNPTFGSYEGLFWAGSIGASLLQIKKIKLTHLLLLSLVFFILWSAILNQVSGDPAFHENIKYAWMSLAFVLSGGLLFETKEEIRDIQNCFLIAVAVLVPIFFYRYLVLSEIREFDARPVINLRHGDPNFLAFIFSFAYFLALEIKNKKTQIASLILFASGIVATQSRMGVLALGLGNVFWAMGMMKGQRKKQIIFISTILGAGLLTLILFPDLLLRFEHLNDKSNEERVRTWANGLTLFLENPWFGVGIDTSENYLFQTQGYPPFQSLENSLTVHNTYLKALAELGFVGALPLLIWQMQILYRSKKSSLAMQALIGVSFFSAFFIGICFKDFYLIGLSLIEQKQLTEEGQL